MTDNMVSINKNFNTGQTGAAFFNSTEEDGRLVNQNAPPQPHHFEPLKTIPFSTIHIVVSTIISIIGIVLAIKHPDLEHKCRTYFIMLYLHAAFWFFTLLIDYILKRAHHNLRVGGYLEFYQKTYTLHRLPIYIVSLWNAFLLIIQTVSQHYYPDNFSEQCIKEGPVTPVSYITGFIWIETFLLSVTHGQYIKKVSSFNKCQHRPDVQRDHLVEGGAVGGSSGQAPTTQQSAPLTQTLTQTADLLARQADLIRHLREHNEKLSNKLSATTAQVRTLQQQQANVGGEKSSPSVN